MLTARPWREETGPSGMHQQPIVETGLRHGRVTIEGAVVAIVQPCTARNGRDCSVEAKGQVKVSGR